MKVEYDVSPGSFSMTFHPQKGEGIDVTQRVTMGNKKCTTYLPNELSIQSLHPDVLGLVTLLIVYPYTKSQITLPIGVSQAFHNEVKKATAISLLPINTKLKPRKAPIHSIPALAYSGGIDSTACLSIMPASTCSVFHVRSFPKDDRHNQDAALHTCQSLKKSGHHIHMIKSDFDHIRHPRGFAVEMSTTIPALLLSEYIGFDSIAVGTTLEYHIDHSQYYKKRTYSIQWDKLFKAVDIQLNQPTTGISEIGTYEIVLHSPYSHLAESCTCGTLGKPCMKCFKCFRKQLSKIVITKQSMSDELLDCQFRISSVRAKLEKFPIFFENIITYITANYHGNHSLMNMLKRKTRGHITDVTWMEKWYSPYEAFIPPKYRAEIKRNIMNHLDVMTESDEKNMIKWQQDFAQALISPTVKKYHSEFVHAVRKHK